ncbi:Uncharacterised protein [Escherichia coli]|nr:Uncharacterised protein [Escherichia coli]
MLKQVYEMKVQILNNNCEVVWSYDIAAPVDQSGDSWTNGNIRLWLELCSLYAVLWNRLKYFHQTLNGNGLFLFVQIRRAHFRKLVRKSHSKSISQLFPDFFR